MERVIVNNIFDRQSPAEFVSRLENQKIRLWVHEGSLHYKAPKGEITPEILKYLRDHKQEIINHFVLKDTLEDLYQPIEPVEEQTEYPLSPAQRRMFLLHQIDRESTAYNLSQVLKINGALDRRRLEAVIRKLIERHESLRTSFSMAKEGPVQRIHKNIEFSIECRNVAGANAEINRIIADFIRPFDLSKPPIFRFMLLELESAKKVPIHLLIQDMHHIISDGISEANLVKEVNRLYAEKSLPELKIQYKDYTAWYRKLLTSPQIRDQRRFWLEQLRGEIPVLNLPTDYPRPPVFSFEGESIAIRIDKELVNRLQHLARENRATMYTLLLTVYYVLLFKYTGQTDIIVGTPVAGRRHADTYNLIGIFVNTLVLRNFPESEKTFITFLQEVGNTVLQAFDNQDYPFEQIVEELNIPRDLSRNPIFDTMFNLLNMRVDDLEAAGLEFSQYDFQRKTAQFDLNITIIENSAGIDIKINYCTSLFNREMITRFGEHYHGMLNTVASNPVIKLAEIDILTPPEKDQILNRFNNTAVKYRQDVTIYHLFEEQVERTPAGIAVIFGDRKLTYAELNSRANQLARILQKKGIGSESIVAVIMERSLEMIVALMAILKAGGAYLPLNPENPAERIRYMIEDSGAKVVLTQNRYLERLSMDKELPCNLDIFDLETAATYAAEASNLGIINNSNSLAYIIYTSGSTGKPKGVMIEHHSLVNRLCWMQKMYPLNADDVVLQKTPYSFDVSVWELFWWSICGSSVCLLKPGAEKDPDVIIETIVKNNITTMHFVPSMLNAFLDYLENRQAIEDVSSLRQVFTSGEALGVNQVNRFQRLLHQPFATKLHNLYGPTEATIDVSYFDCTVSGQPLKTVPIGKPIANIKLYILDKHNKLQPIGIPGELYIAGDGVGRGYLNRPELTMETFVPNPYAIDKEQWKTNHGQLNQNNNSPLSPLASQFDSSANSQPSNDSNYQLMYRTGDLARWLSDGNIEFLGRIDHQVKIRGFRIELGEIENCLLAYEGMEEAIVLAMEDVTGNKNLYAYIVSANELNIPDLKNHLLKTLPDYMIPSYFAPLDKLPLTANGKVDRKALSRLEVSLNTGTEYIAPRNETEQQLAEIWQEILGIKKIGIDNDFFELGGNSLLIIKLELELEKRNIPVKSADLFKCRTISRLATLITGGKFNEEFETPNGPIPNQQVLLSATHSLKVLPIKFELPIHGKCWDTQRLAAIMADEKNIIWFLDKFLSLYLHKDFTLRSYNSRFLEHMSIYDEILEYHRILDINPGNIIAELIAEIDNNRYVLFIMDYYHIKNSICYQKTHAVHDGLLYGYNRATQEFYYLDIPEDNYANKIITIKFDELANSFFSGVELMKAVHDKSIGQYETMEETLRFYLLHNMPLTSFTIKDIHKEPDLARIYHALFFNDLNGNVVENTSVKKGANSRSREWYGNAVYKGLYTDLFDHLLNENQDLLNQNPNILGGVKHLYEVKKSYILRLQYLKNNNLINFDAKIISEITELCNSIQSVFELFVKFSHTFNRDFLINAKEILIRVEKTDNQIVASICELLYLQMRDEFYFEK